MACWTVPIPFVDAIWPRTRSRLGVVPVSEVIGRLAVLAFPAVIGALVASRRWWGSSAAVTSALNRFAVDLAFPMLVMSGITAVDGTLPSSIVFWVAVPLVDLALIAVVFVAGARLSRVHRGAAALIGMFPNSAYLGLPLVVALYGEEIRAAASAWVAIQVGLAVAVGPLLMRWALSGGGASSPGGGARSMVGVLTRPLVLAPVVGLAARALGGSFSGAIHDLSEPIGRAASPVALFVLGMYCVAHRGDVRTAFRSALAAGTWRMLGVPALAVGVAQWQYRSAEWTPELATVFVVLFAMPAGITTFALTLDASEGEGAAAAGGEGEHAVAVVASTIVVSSVVALAWLPVVVSSLDKLFGVDL